MEHKTTPLMQQYHALKLEHPDKLIFFQVGDFYELFFEDAIRAANFLGIALTKRGKDQGKDIPLCGVPVHSLNHYLTKLIKGGFCVALCDQLEAAQVGKMVKRGITKVLTPGTLTDEHLMDDTHPSYIMSFVPHQDQWALLFAEIVTAQVYATTITAGARKLLETELARFFPDEIIMASTGDTQQFKTMFNQDGYYTSTASPDQQAMLVWAQAKLQQAVVDQLTANHALQEALAVLYNYCAKNNSAVLEQIATLHFYQPEDFLVLDNVTQKHLELVINYQGQRAGTLLATLDKAATPMGSRTLKKWLVRPLRSIHMINQRFDAVDFLRTKPTVLDALQHALRTCGDVERVVGRIALGRAPVRDYVQLITILQTVPELAHKAVGAPALLAACLSYAQQFAPLLQLLQTTLSCDAQQDWIIASGYHTELDRLRLLVTDSTQILLKLEQEQQQATGINSLKIRYNAIHGYYAEITNTHQDLVPAHYKRRQTLVGRERYTFEALEKLEHDMLHAQSSMSALERQLFDELKARVVPYVSALRRMALGLAHADALMSFARCAYERGYVRPAIAEDQDIVVMGGKHPVVEQARGSAFIANDTQLTNQQALWIITGPNMGGKSTYLRQVALLSIMAQCGSFIPARSAQLPVLDAIFTRIGASDNVAAGKSTFMVEMEETAHICQYATQKSLVILDEVGRGTSTYDGLALAQALVEYLYTQVRARCLFATHYHELTQLAQQYPGIVCYHAQSMQTADGILFLHTMVPGIAAGSFGLEVARLAGLPASVLARASQVLQGLNQDESARTHDIQHVYEPARADTLAAEELAALKKYKNVVDTLDYDTLSPKKAFDILWDLKQ